MPYFASLAFVEVPVNQEVPMGAEATFRCQHPTADTIRWRVNGSLVGRSTPPDIAPQTIRKDNGNLVGTLSITARPEYNRTMVVGVARFDDGTPDEQTQPAMLIGTCNDTHIEAFIYMFESVMFSVIHTIISLV